MARSLIALIGMACVFTLTGCVSDGNSGKGSLTVSDQVAAEYQEYMKQENPARFYVSEDGQCGFYSFCPRPPCRSIVSEEKLLENCSAKCDSACKVLAVGGRLVWQGKVLGLGQPQTGMVHVSWGSYNRHGNGLARLDASGTTAQIEFTLKGTRETCRGTLERKSKKAGQWSIFCNKGLKGSGVASFFQDEKYDISRLPVPLYANAIYPGEWRVLAAGADPWKRPIWFLLRGLDDWADVETADTALRTDAPVAATEPAEVFRDCGTCPEMVTVPAGKFTMGSADGHPDEFPPHEVQIDKPFAVGRFEVTSEEWRACMADDACKRLKDDGWGRGRRPAIFVGWRDAQDFLSWLSRKTGKSYRLLTEAEFEYASRAGSTTEYPWGDTIDPSYVEIYAERASEVGRFKPNAFGLFDMNGNAWEWVADCYQHYEYVKSDPSAVVGQCANKRFPERVLRGGFWQSSSESVRSAKREHRMGGDIGGWFFTGFRVARDLE